METIKDKNMKDKFTMCNRNNFQDNSKNRKRRKCKFGNIRKDL